MSNITTKSKRTIIFRCITHGKAMSELNIEQGILYPSGKCIIGIDVWRDLNPHDCSSHSTKHYRSMDDVKKDYYVVSTKSLKRIG